MSYVSLYKCDKKFYNYTFSELKYSIKIFISESE